MRVIVYEYTGSPVRPWYKAWYNWNSPLQMQHHDLSREKLLAMEEDFPLFDDLDQGWHISILAEGDSSIFGKAILIVVKKAFCAGSKSHENVIFENGNKRLK